MASSSERNVEELKSLVVHTLETNGVLGQIRAQLRANVYKAIDEEENPTSVVALGPVKLKKTRYGRLMAEIVAEFFEFYEFKHSLSVFAPESNLGKDRRSRTDIALEAGLPRVLSDVSILEQLIGLATGSELHKGAPSPPGWHSSASSTTASSPPPQPPSLVSSRQQTTDGPISRSETPPPLPPSAGAGAGPGKDAAMWAPEESPQTEAAKPDTAAERQHRSSAAASKSPSTSPLGEARNVRSADIAMEYEQVPEEAPEEAGRERRRPQERSLPSLPGSPNGSASGSSAKDRGLTASASAAGSAVAASERRAASEEVSMTESMGGTSRDSFDEVDRKLQAQIDQKIQRLNRCAAGGGDRSPELSMEPAEPAEPEAVGAQAEEELEKEQQRSPPRSRSGSPVDSAVGSGSPPRSANHTPPRSSSRSPPRSASPSHSESRHSSPPRSRSPSPLASRDNSPVRSPVRARSPAHSDSGSKGASLAGSPVASVHSPLSSSRSPAASPAQSPAASNASAASAAKSAGSRSRSGDGEAVPRSPTEHSQASRSGSDHKRSTHSDHKRSTHSDNRVLISPEGSLAEESISVGDDDNQSGSSGSLDLTGEPLGGGPSASGGVRRTPPASAAAGRGRSVEEEAENSIEEERFASGSSIQGAGSEAKDSDDDKF